MPTQSDMLLQATDAIDVDRPTLGVDTRALLGYPRLTKQGVTDTDAEIAHEATAGIPAENLPVFTNGIAAAPEPTDPIADVKRAAMFTSHTGVNFITGGRFTSYLRGNFDTRVLDGSAIFQVIDQSFEPIPDQEGKSKPGLSYLRLGKPEPRLKGEDGKALPAASDKLGGQKYASGIGMFSDGTLDIWTKKAITLQSSDKVNIIADAKDEVILGDNYKATYAYVSEEDEEKVQRGEIKPQQAARKLLSLEYERHGITGGYEQKYERSQKLEFGAANKGEVAFSSKYDMSVGIKTDHTMSLEFGTSVSGKIELKKSYELEIGEHGAVFHGTAGKWTRKPNENLLAEQTVIIGVDPLADLPYKTAASVFKTVAKASGAAQLAAMTVYNTVLFAKSMQVLSPADETAMESKTPEELDNDHDLKTALDAGMALYETCVITDMVVAAASALLAALRAKSLGVPNFNPLAPTITIDSTEITLQVGATHITLNAQGITSSGPMVQTNAVQIAHNAVQVAIQPGGPLPPPPPPLPPLPDEDPPPLPDEDDAAALM